MIPKADAISLTPDRWQRIERIFHEAMRTPESGRAEFLLKSCEGDSTLEAEVQDLLAAFEDEKRFTQPAGAIESKGRLGEIVGGYRLEAELGQGGMGTVYLAHRADGEFEHQVALKVVSSHLRTRFFTERFRAERQILATLNHPNITRLLDGGLSSTGDPYLVMEYVDGQALNRYCDGELLSVSDRIQLFLQVCSGVEYAHRQLVVHRDLKPGNILVTKEGVPKLLDFGTAKLLLTGLADSATTRFGAMTPRYASPEQLRGESVSTSMDVYSLGVVLYELLAGAWPFGDPDSLVAGLERAVRDVDPAPPRSLITDEAARLRSTSKAKLARVLDGDLRNILSKAVDSNPQRRYSSVEHLSEDLRRYLRGEPVQARAGTPYYRAAKFIRRHRLAVSAAVLFVTVLASSTIYSHRQAQAARSEAEKSAMVTEFFRGLLNAADPTIEGGRKNITVLEALDWSRRQLDQLDAQPQVKAYLHFTLGITFENLSDYTKAEEQLRGALALARQGQGISASDFIWAETGVAGVLTRIGKDWEEAEGLYRDAVARTRKLGRSANPQLVHVAVGQYGYLLWKRHGHSRQAEAQMREAVDLARTSPAISRTWVVIGDYEFAQYLIEENRDAEAAKLLTEALSVERGFSRPTSTLGPVLSTLGSLRLKQGDLAGAEEYQRQYRDEMLRQVGPNHAYSVDALANWAVAESRLGHAAEAAEASRSALDTGRRLFPAGGQNLWPPLFARASVLNDEGRFKDAEALARESLQCLPSKNEQDPRLAQSWGEIGIALLGEKRSAEAIPALETSERIFLAIRGWGTGHPNTTRVRQAQSRARAGTSQN